jgi:hypothetical protein
MHAHVAGGCSRARTGRVEFAHFNAYGRCARGPRTALSSSTVSRRRRRCLFRRDPAIYRSHCTSALSRDLYLRVRAETNGDYCSVHNSIERGRFRVNTDQSSRTRLGIPLILWRARQWHLATPSSRRACDHARTLPEKGLVFRLSDKGRELTLRP